MPTLDIVIAGLDPAIHHIELNYVLMDARVKPAHDESEISAVGLTRTSEAKGH